MTKCDEMMSQYFDGSMNDCFGFVVVDVVAKLNYSINFDRIIS